MDAVEVDGLAGRPVAHIEGAAHAHARARRPRLPDTDIVPHQGVAPDGAPLPELSQEALHEVSHPHVEDVDGWYYEQPPFDLDWVLGPDGFDPPPGERGRRGGRGVGARASPAADDAAAPADPLEPPGPRDPGPARDPRHPPWQ